MTFFEVEKNKLIIVILKKKVLIFCAQRDILEECAAIYMLYKNKQKPKKTELTLRVILTVVLILFVTDSTGGCIRCKVHNRTFLKFLFLTWVTVALEIHRAHSIWPEQVFFQTWIHYVQAHGIMWQLGEKKNQHNEQEQENQQKTKPS